MQYGTRELQRETGHYLDLKKKGRMHNYAVTDLYQACFTSLRHFTCLERQIDDLVSSHQKGNMQIDWS